MIDSVTGIIAKYVNVAPGWRMKKFITETLFYAVSSAIILPAPILLLAWMTEQTWREVLFR